MSGAQRTLVITADDFGAHVDVNAAIEMASHAGALSAASLMVGGAAVADAVARARRLPNLRVGLHLTLVDGLSCLPTDEIPLLVDAQRRFPSDMARFGVRIATDCRLRTQLQAEVRAQFEAYARLGLDMDHVNCHKHLHLHPVILDMILRIGPQYGMKALRVPQEPWRYVWNEPDSPRAALANAALRPLLLLMKRRLARAGISSCDRVYGIRWSGAMVLPRLLKILRELPDGRTEIYLHPATRSGTAISAAMQGYQNAAELEALLSVDLAAALRNAGLVPGGYADT